MLAAFLLMLSVFFSFNESNSLKEKIKPQLFLDKNEIIDYPDKGLFLQLKDKRSKKKRLGEHKSKRKNAKF